MPRRKKVEIDAGAALEAAKAYGYQCYQHGRYRGQAQHAEMQGTTDQHELWQKADLHERAAKEAKERLEAILGNPGPPLVGPGEGRT